jgi:hypothetical protein
VKLFLVDLSKLSTGAKIGTFLVVRRAAARGGIPLAGAARADRRLGDRGCIMKSTRSAWGSRHCRAVSGAAFADDGALAPGDFAYGRAVETQRGDALQTLLLDLPIYRGSVGPELVDLRVFNGAGEVVPHAIRALADPSEQEGALVSVPLFRVPGDSALARNPIGSVRERDVDIEVAADGAIVRVAADRPGADTTARLPSAYLIDVSQLEEQKRAVCGPDSDACARARGVRDGAGASRRATTSSISIRSPPAPRWHGSTRRVIASSRARSGSPESRAAICCFRERSRCRSRSRR